MKKSFNFNLKTIFFGKDSGNGQDGDRHSGSFTDNFMQTKMDDADAESNVFDAAAKKAKKELISKGIKPTNKAVAAQIASDASLDDKGGDLDELKEKVIEQAKKELTERNLDLTEENIIAQASLDGNLSVLYNKKEMALSSMSNEELLSRADAFLKSNKKKVTLYSLFSVLCLNLAILSYRTLFCFFSVNRVIVSVSPVYIIISCFGPIILWIFLTTDTYFNFYNKKLLALYFTLGNIGLTLWQIIYTIIWDVLVTKIFLIPVNRAFTANMVVNLARIVLFAFFAIFIVAYYKAVFPFLLSKEAKVKVLSFKMEQIVDNRPFKDYQYDFIVCKNLKTGAIMRVKEIDRFVHFLVLGASGTGKTSTIYTPQIIADIEQKMINVHMQQKLVVKMMKEGAVKIVKPFNVFHKRYFECVDPNRQKEFDDIFKNYKDCGITVVAPNNSMNEDILDFCSARGIWVNNIDPTKKTPTHPYERLCGMNPLYIPEELHFIDKDDVVREEIRTKYIDVAASNISDSITALNELNGRGDPYFTEVNNTVVNGMAKLLMLSHSIMGTQATMADLNNVIISFPMIVEHVDNICEHFGIEIPDALLKGNGSSAPSGSGRAAIAADERVKAESNPYYSLLLTAKSRFVKGGQLDEHAEGLRNLLGRILENPDVKRIFTAMPQIVDHDENLQNNSITVVNTALELGANASTCLGQLFILNFNSAVLRRKKDENLTPHFFFQDETARYLSNTIDTMVTLYRQYKVSCCFALQSLAQPAKSESTRYLKDILLDVGTLIAFGATNVADSEEVSALSGDVEYDMVQHTSSHSSIWSDNPGSSFSDRTTPDRKKNVEESDVRFRGFQEFTLITRDAGRVVGGRLGKGEFVPKEKFNRVQEEIEKNDKWRLLWASLCSKVKVPVPAEKPVKNKDVKLSDPGEVSDNNTDNEESEVTKQIQKVIDSVKTSDTTDTTDAVKKGDAAETDNTNNTLNKENSQPPDDVKSTNLVEGPKNEPVSAEVIYNTDDEADEEDDADDSASEPIDPAVARIERAKAKRSVDFLKSLNSLSDED